MPTFTAGGTILEADLFVFDKDGLMFESLPFWIELMNERCRTLLPVLGPAQTERWAHLMGADTVIAGDGEPRTGQVNPLGLLAVASPFEERTVTAGCLVAQFGWSWPEARDRAQQLFERADRALNLRRALKPRPGFVELMGQLSQQGIPYGVATSDTYDRVKDSMSLYGCWEKVQFVVTPEDVAQSKPAPDMLRLIAGRTGVPMERIVMVGDSSVDVEMAERAGSLGIGVSTDPAMRERMRPFAAAVLNSLEEIVL